MRKAFPPVTFFISLLVTLLIFSNPAVLLSQEDPVQDGIQAYQDLDFSGATQILNPLTYDSSIALDRRVTARSYLGAANVFLGQVSSAETVYRNLLTDDPTFRPDQLVFPPEVTTFFEQVRVRTRVVRTVPQENIEAMIGVDTVLIDIVASIGHTVVAEMHFYGAGALETVQRVYSGEIGETDRIAWDPGAVGVEKLMSDSVWLSIVSLSPGGAEERRVVLPLHLTITRPDTLDHPVFPAEMILPELGPRRRGPSLMAGALGGMALALAPAIASPEAQLNGARFSIMGGIVLAATIGLIKPAPGLPIPANVEANRMLREQWQARLDQVLIENERLRVEIRLTVRPGTQVLFEPGSR